MRVQPAMEVEERPDAASSPGSPCFPRYCSPGLPHDLVIGLFINRYEFGGAI